MANYLVHSASNPQPDELYHFKYLKKYKVRGKWRYVYADKKTHNEMSRLNDQLLDDELHGKSKEDLRWIKQYGELSKEHPWGKWAHDPRATYESMKGDAWKQHTQSRRINLDARTDTKKRMDEIMKKNGVSTKNMSKGKKWILNLLAIKG